MTARMLAGIAAALALAAPAAAADLRVFPIAGDRAGFSGDGGGAWDARLRPSSVALAPDGSLLVLDAGNQRVRRITRTGRLTTVAGTGARGFRGDGGPATKARLSLYRDLEYRSTGLQALPDGSFLIADAGNGRLRRVAPDGTITTVAGAGARGYAGDGGPATLATLDRPSDLAPLADGRTLVAAGTLRALGADGSIGTLLGRGRCTAGDGHALVKPEDADAAPDGSLVIADAGCVWRLGADGRLTPLAGNPFVSNQPDDGYAGPALAAPMETAIRVAALAGGGALVVLDDSDVSTGAPADTVWRIGPDGRLARIAGCTTGCAPLADGGDARRMTLGAVSDVVAQADGTAVILATGGLVRVGADGVAHVAPPAPGLTRIAIAPDGTLDGIRTCVGGCASPPQVVRLAPDGSVAVLATQATGDPYPRDLSVTADGSVVVLAGTRVQRVTADGRLETVRDVPVANAEWSGVAIAAMPGGGLAVVHQTSGTAFLNSAGDVQTIAADGTIATPAGPETGAAYVRADWRVAGAPDGGIVAVGAPDDLEIVRVAPGAAPQVIHRKRPADEESGEDQVAPTVAGRPGRDVLIAVDNRLYRLDGTRLRRLDGTGTGGYFGSIDGALLRQAWVGPADDLVPVAGGALYIVGDGRVRLLAPARSGVAAIAITRDSLRVSRGRAIAVRTTRAGIVDAVALDARGRVAGRARNEVAAGRGVVTFPRLPAGAYLVRAVLRTASGARAGDTQPLLLGGLLPLRAAKRMANDDARWFDRTRARAADDVEIAAHGTGACRRIGPDRVDCRVYRADGSSYSGFTSRTCAVLAVRIGGDGVVRVRRYGDRDAKDPQKSCRPSEYAAFTAAPRWSTLRWAEAAPLRLR